MEPADADAVFALEVGELSDVIRANGTFHIFKAMGRKTELPFELVNNVMEKKALSQVVNYCYRILGAKATVVLSDRLKDMGYRYATQAGISISVDDMVIPHNKWKIIDKAGKGVAEINEQYTEGLITRGEKYNKVVDIWAKATTHVANVMMEEMKVAPLWTETASQSLMTRAKRS